MTTQREPAYVIDPRARAMLQEMGVRVWLPSEAAQTPPVARAMAAPLQANQSVASQPTVALPAREVVVMPVRRDPPLRLPVMDAPPATASALGEVRYVIGNLPTEASDYDLVVLGEPCQGAAANLLVNLLKPLVSTASRIFIAHMVASQNDAVSLRDQLATIPAKLLLALGPHAAKALLDKAAEGIPFSKLRGAVHPPQCVVTYHPQQLLRQPSAKAQAWMDVKLALQTLKKAEKQINP